MKRKITKTRFNRIMRVLRRNSLKKNENRKEVLTRVLEVNNKQYFTDSFVLFEINEIIQDLPQLDDGMEFPMLALDLITKAKERNTMELRANCKDLKEFIKTSKDYIGFNLTKDLILGVKKELLMDVLIILDYKSKDEVVFKYDVSSSVRDGNIMSPLLFENEEGVALLMPTMFSGSTDRYVTEVNTVKGELEL